MKLLSLLCVFFLFIENLKAQNFTIGNISKTSSEINQLQSKAFDLTTLLPKNFVINATVDYTEFIQRGLDKYQSVKMPNFPVLVNSKGLKINSNAEIFFSKKSSIVIQPNSLSSYAILNIQGKQNVKIYNARLVGDRFQHNGNQGEWGMGIRIMDSRNVVLYNPNIMNCWGDGIYIGDDNQNSIHNKNIFILNCSINSNRRNGITITSGESIYVRGGSISKSDGTMPKAGLDIEPNSNYNVINNINVRNLKTNNEGAGIIISLGKLSNKAGQVDITVDGHTDNGGSMGLYIPNLNSPSKSILGSIVIRNSNYINNKTNGIFIENYSSNNTPKIIISDSKIINSNSSSQKSPRWGAGISFGRDSRKRVFDKMGNLNIKNITIIENRPSPLMQAAISFVDDNNSDFEKVNIEGIKIQGINSSNQFFLKKGVSLK